MQKLLPTNFSIQQWVLCAAIITGAWSVSLLFLFALSIYPAFSPWPISIHPAHPNSREFLLWDAFPDCPSQMKNFFLHTSLAASSYLASQYTSPCLLFFCFCFSVSHPAWTSWGRPDCLGLFSYQCLTECLFYNSHSIYVCRINEWMNEYIYYILSKFISRLNTLEFLLV